MYVVTEIIHSRKRLYSVLSVLLLTLFFVIIDVMIQYWGKSIVHHSPLIFGRVSGPMNHPNDLGTLLVTVLPVVLILTITVRIPVPLSAEGVLYFFCFGHGSWPDIFPRRMGCFCSEYDCLGVFLKVS